MHRRALLARLLKTSAAPLLLSACGGGSESVAGASVPPPMAPQAADWAALVDALVEVLQTAHVQPWKRVPQATFLAQAQALKLRINGLPQQLAAVEAMALIASVGDGHTNIATWNLHRWLGLGLHAFNDGLFVASTSAAQLGLLGAQVLKVGDMSAAQVQAQAARLWPAENESAALAWGAWMASSINALRWMGAASDLQQVSFTLRRPGSAADEMVTLPADSAFRIDPAFEPQGVALNIANINALAWRSGTNGSSPAAACTSATWNAATHRALPPSRARCSARSTACPCAAWWWICAATGAVTAASGSPSCKA